MGTLRSTLLAALVALASLSTSAPARACDCNAVPPGAALAHADAVVLVTAVRVVRHPGMRRVEVVARVDRAWKGARAGQLVSLWATGTSCDLFDASSAMWRGQRVFFARRDEQGRLVPGYCDQPWWGRRMEVREQAAALDALTSDGAR